jgi:hypothetical protein
MQSNRIHKEIHLKLFHLFPAIDLPNEVEEIYGAHLKRQTSVGTEKPEDIAQLNQLWLSRFERDSMS